MKIAVAGGAEIEVATKQDLDERMDTLEHLLRKKLETKTLSASTPGAVSAPANPVLLDFGACPPGSFWSVELVALWYIDVWTAAANVTGAVFVGRPNIPGGPPIMPDVRAPGIAIPGSETFGGLRISAKAGEHVYCLIGGSGLNALAGQLSGTCNVVVIPDLPETRFYL